MRRNSSPNVLPSRIGARIGEFGREDAGRYSGGEHGRRVARTFLVGPIYDLEWGVGLVASFAQRAHGFERAEDAERTVS
jgi:hypothetical protein